MSDMSCLSVCRMSRSTHFLIWVTKTASKVIPPPSWLGLSKSRRMARHQQRLTSAIPAAHAGVAALDFSTPTHSCTAHRPLSVRRRRCARRTSLPCGQPPVVDHQTTALRLRGSCLGHQTTVAVGFECELSCSHWTPWVDRHAGMRFNVARFTPPTATLSASSAPR